MTDSSRDVNLLTGILALQLNFIDKDQLIKAMHAWVMNKSRPLGDILVELGFLTSDRLKRLNGVLQDQLKHNDQDARKSLSQLEVVETIRKDLEALKDQEVCETMDRVRGDAGKQKEEEDDEDFSTQTFTIDEQASAGTRFRIIRPHAKGGLGKVSLAWDEELHRQVALKELQSKRADNVDSRTRFVMEAEVNGGLEHPGIVPVYALGQYADGRPYYAMRFIRGKTLSDAIEQFHRAEKSGRDPGVRSLEFRQLLRRFTDVCQAMQYAHHRHVVHRDLKPDNIMLGAHGETLVVDWGLAKVGEQEDSGVGLEEPPLVLSAGSHSTPTIIGLWAGTPAYMSPEQARGAWNVVGPSSDIYSLGATLYEILTGQKAFPGRDALKTVEKVKARDFVPPREVQANVPKPLEAICLKAMAEHAEDRYASAAALCDDIEHWLADEPVSVYRDSLVERGFRWFRHHRGLAISVGLGLAAVTLISVVAAALIKEQQKVAERERDAANEQRELAVSERNKAEVARKEADEAREQAVRRFRQARGAVDTWLTLTSGILDFFPDMSNIQLPLLEKAAEDYELLLETDETTDISTTEQRDMQIERGRALLRLGDVYCRLPDNNGPTDFASKAEQAYSYAVSALAAVTQKHPQSLDAQLESARAESRLSELLDRDSRSDDATKRLETAIARLRQLASQQPDEPRVHELLGVLLQSSGERLLAGASSDHAEAILNESIRELEKAAQTIPDKFDTYLALGAAHTSMARHFTESRRLDQAADHFAKAVQAFDQNDEIKDLRSLSDSYVATRANVYTARAGLARSKGDWRDEEWCHEEKINKIITLLRSYPTSPVLNEELAIAVLQRGMFLKFIGKLTEANEELLEVDSLLGQPSDDPFIMFHSINCRDGLAEILADQGEYDEAHALFSQALEIATALASNDADNIDDALLLSTIESHFAQLLAKMEQMTEATERFDSSVARLENLVQRTPDRCDIQSRLAFVLQYYGRMEFAAGNAEKAAQLFGRAKTQWEALLAPSTATDANSALDLNYLAWFLVICPDATLRDPTRAESLARRALEVSPHNPDFSATLGAALYRQDKFTDAKPAFAAAEKNRGEPSARDLFFLSMIHVREGDQLAAETLFQQAESLMAEQQPENAELKQLRDEAQSLRTPR